MTGVQVRDHPSRQSQTKLPWAGRIYALAALAEGISWAGLLLGMFVKHVLGWTPLLVTIFGTLHGYIFIGYLAITVVAAIALRWRWWVTVVSMLAAIPPLVTIPWEMWLRRTGRLRRRPGTGPTEDPPRSS